MEAWFFTQSSVGFDLRCALVGGLRSSVQRGAAHGSLGQSGEKSQPKVTVRALMLPAITSAFAGPPLHGTIVRQNVHLPRGTFHPLCGATRLISAAELDSRKKKKKERKGEKKKTTEHAGRRHNSVFWELSLCLRGHKEKQR